jgi:hypothetical protein
MLGARGCRRAGISRSHEKIRSALGQALELSPAESDIGLIRIGEEAGELGEPGAQPIAPLAKSLVAFAHQIPRRWHEKSRAESISGAALEIGARYDFSG